jgi:phosphopantetheinyl transferase (holo-ACP synthase)
MIGNDIVDISLASTQSNWRRTGFLEKLFSKSEIDLVMRDECPTIMVWRLWSMKESAYKANYRLDKVRKFNPKQLECKLIDDQLGEVKISTNLYKIRTEINQLYIHSIALKDRFKKSIQQNIHNKGSILNSSELYDLLLQHVAISGNYNKHELLLRKTTEFIPELYSSKNKLKTICSLSHHGKYGAYIFTN